VKFLRVAMGCSAKTAARVLSSSRPYASQLKRAYAIAFSISVGCPLDTVTQPSDPDYTTSIRGWLNTNPASLATKLAATLGAGIATRSMRVHSMLADFTVIHGIDGRPSVLRVSVSPVAGSQMRHTLAIAESSFANCMLLTHLDNKNSQRCQVTPSEENIDRILKSIKNEHKNNATRIY
jgi:hypothetical protein